MIAIKVYGNNSDSLNSNSLEISENNCGCQMQEENSNFCVGECCCCKCWRGPKGERGYTGSQGPMGVTGPQGTTGPAGPRGVPGETGATGSTGAIGPQGPRGYPGETGETGPEGPRGPRGFPGETGAAGPQGPAFSSSFASIYGTGALDQIVYYKGDTVLYNEIGTMFGSDIKCCPTSGEITLAGGKAYLAIFKGAFDIIACNGFCSLELYLNNKCIGGSRMSTIADKLQCEQRQQTLTTTAVFTTCPGKESILTVKLDDTSPTKIFDPCVNIVVIG